MLPVWTMTCLERSPTLTNDLSHIWHWWGRTLSWWRMWLASWLDCTNLPGRDEKYSTVHSKKNPSRNTYREQVDTSLPSRCRGIRNGGQNSLPVPYDRIYITNRDIQVFLWNYLSLHGSKVVAVSDTWYQYARIKYLYWYRSEKIGLEHPYLFPQRSQT